MDFLADSLKVSEPQSGVSVYLRQGDAPAVQFTHTTDADPPVPVDISQWRIAVVEASAFTGKIGEYDEDGELVQYDAPRELEPDATASIIMPRAEKAVQTGVYFVHYPTDFYTSTTPLEPNSIWVPVVVVKVEVAQPNGVVDHLLIQTVVLYGIED